MTTKKMKNTDKNTKNKYRQRRRANAARINTSSELTFLGIFQALAESDQPPAAGREDPETDATAVGASDGEWLSVDGEEAGVSDTEDACLADVAATVDSPDDCIIDVHADRLPGIEVRDARWKGIADPTWLVPDEAVPPALRSNPEDQPGDQPDEAVLFRPRLTLIPIPE